ncbi:MAG: hypothetical protein U1G07_02480 [Verrucomicrobiota bacterium]
MAKPSKGRDCGSAVAGVQEWRVPGTPVARIGAANIVTGAHRYPSDIVRPGMLYGKVLRPDSFGVVLAEIDVGIERSGVPAW